MKLGLIAFGNDGGLGAQTRRLAKMLNPDKILLIDSSGFSKNREVHKDWYPKRKTTVVNGFPRGWEVLAFIEGLTHVFMCEDPYSDFLVNACRSAGIKTICQVNYEFCRNLRDKSLSVPDLFLMPSYWKLQEMEAKFGKERVKYLPPPIPAKEFNEIRKINLSRRPEWRKRFLHVVGTLAIHDRNGTLAILGALKYTKSPFELVVRSQKVLPEKYLLKDPRVRYEIGSAPTNAELYQDFDAMILPRRYGGLSLGMNEALTAGLPVMMPDISPNNMVLPSEWLFPAKKYFEFEASDTIDVYLSDRKAIAAKIDEWVENLPSKYDAITLSMKYREDLLWSNYDSLFQK